MNSRRILLIGSNISEELLDTSKLIVFLIHTRHQNLLLNTLTTEDEYLVITGRIHR